VPTIQNNTLPLVLPVLQNPKSPAFRHPWFFGFHHCTVSVNNFPIISVCAASLFASLACVYSPSVVEA
jgi:hypothetical protein